MGRCKARASDTSALAVGAESPQYRAMSDRGDLELLLQSHIPLLTIDTHEEPRAVRLLAACAGRLGKRVQLWSITDGLRALPYPSPSANLSDELRLAGDAGAGAAGTHEPPAALRRIKAELSATIFILLDFHAHLDDPVIVRLIKEIALNFSVREHHLVFVSHHIELPAELSRLSARFDLKLPSADELRTLINEEAELWKLKNGERVRAEKPAVQQLVNNLLGLTLSDAAMLIRKAIRDDGAILSSDIPPVVKAKYTLLGNDGALSFEHDTATLVDVGGLERLKQWLQTRHKAFVNGADLDAPKGVLLVGVQGGGKSLAAKAVAGVWGVPLLRLDFGALYNKFFGETEKNMREALKTASAMAPCVLWVDEIEKGVATGDNDGGTSRRVLATLLTWMAENRSRVFIVATANDIQHLPPELVRKGRMDEIFFVDLPDADTRAQIYGIHLRKRGLDPASFDLPTLAQASEGFSGAEIEQSVVAARYAVYGEGELSTAHVLAEIAQTKPLSVVMADRIQALRTWAAERTVPAD